MKVTVVLVIVVFALFVDGNEECGRSPSYSKYSKLFDQNDDGRVVQKILGGDDSNEGDWPWMASIVSIYKTVQCTGTIISNRWIISAAHCRFNDKLVGVGSVDKRKQKFYSIESVYLHPDYDSKTNKSYDIALLKLNETLEFSKHVKPICLSKSVEVQKHEILITAGWGHIFDYLTKPLPFKSSVKYTDRKLVKTHVPQILQERMIAVYALDYCFNFSVQKNSSTKFICARNFHAGTLPGDSGGPLMARRNGQWYHVGVTHDGMAVSGNTRIDIADYGNYVVTSQFCDFIESTTSGDVKCSE